MNCCLKKRLLWEKELLNNIRKQAKIKADQLQETVVIVKDGSEYKALRLSEVNGLKVLDYIYANR